MVTKMELSLDDIIKTTPGIKRRGAGGARGGGRGGRGGGVRIVKRGGVGGFTSRGGARGGSRGRFTGGGGIRLGRNSGGAEGVWMHDKFQDGGRGRVGVATVGGGGGGSKITVSNLHYGVSDADIIELFGEIGPIRYASVHYDRSGRSMGKADVVFERRSDAQVAINQYNGVPLDGRAMAITYANSAPTVVVATTSPRSLRQVQGGRIGQRRQPMISPKRGGAAVRRGGRGGGGGTRGGGRGGGRQKPPTAADLDAELDAYISANAK